MKAMLLAAGFGTRLKPFTDKHPKALAMINGKSLLQRNIEFLQQFDIFEVVVNVHHFASQISEEIHRNNGWGSNFAISDETDAVLETGGGLKRAQFFFEKENQFVLMNVDVLTDLNLKAMIVAHAKNKSMATLATTSRKSSRSLLFNEENILCGWKNLKTGETKISQQSKTLIPKAFSGIHILNHEIFTYLPAFKKFSIIDTYLEWCSQLEIRSFDHSGGKFIDVGTTEKMSEAEELFH
ncbi:MAG: NTP transferase domain-containing protein [Bacteroidetes bacterium]|nr:NTP transferase domain-containing protein [Bacteroidota bacterium]